MLSETSGLALMGAILVYERMLPLLEADDPQRFAIEQQLMAIRKDLRDHFSSDFEAVARQLIDAGVGQARALLNKVMPEEPWYERSPKDEEPDA